MAENPGQSTVFHFWWRGPDLLQQVLPIARVLSCVLTVRVMEVAVATSTVFTWDAALLVVPVEGAALHWFSLRA